MINNSWHNKWLGLKYYLAKLGMKNIRFVFQSPSRSCPLSKCVFNKYQVINQKLGSYKVSPKTHSSILFSIVNIKKEKENTT